MNFLQEQNEKDGTASEINYRDYRKDKSDKAKEYQDFVCKYMIQNYGIVLSIFSSRKYQIEIGESMQGIEIKYDIKSEETGNFYIEVGEKAQPREGEYYPSGIYANDNSWLYFIGNYSVLYIFSKKGLRAVHNQKLYYRYVLNNETKTSEGFLIDKNRAEKYCILKINFKNNE